MYRSACLILVVAVSASCSIVRPYYLSSRDRAELEQRAIVGDNTAAIRVAKYYSMDQSNLPEAVAWYSVASKRGDTKASYNLEQLSDLSDSEVSQFRARAVTGDALAAHRLYCYYAFVAKDKEEARKWLEKAAQSGCPQAKRELADQTEQ